MLLSGEHASNLLRSVRPFLDVVPDGLRPFILLAPSIGLESVSEELDAKMDLDAELRSLIVCWNSPSWKATRPLRNILRRIAGKEKEQFPDVCTVSEARQARNAITHSTSWKVMAPVRSIEHIYLSVRGEYRREDRNARP
jgi:hypothetical protein